MILKLLPFCTVNFNGEAHNIFLNLTLYFFSFTSRGTYIRTTFSCYILNCYIVMGKERLIYFRKILRIKKAFDIWIPCAKFARQRNLLYSKREHVKTGRVWNPNREFSLIGRLHFHLLSFSI